MQQQQPGQQQGGDRGQPQHQPPQPHAGVHPSLAGQPGIPAGVAQAIPAPGGQMFAHPMQYPATAVYPPGAALQMVPGGMPGNVYVSNVTANVNVHGWHTPLTQFPVQATYMQAQEVPVAQSPGHDSQVRRRFSSWRENQLSYEPPIR